MIGRPAPYERVRCTSCGAEYVQTLAGYATGRCSSCGSVETVVQVGDYRQEVEAMRAVREQAARETEEHIRTGKWRTCQRCGQVLRNPESVKRGYGDDCWEAMTGQEAKGVPPGPAGLARESRWAAVLAATRPGR